MLPPANLLMPVTWRDLLEELAPVFARRSTHRLFVALACGMILADRSTVAGMAAAAGMAGQWRRACWFFSGAAWDTGELGLAVARLIVKYLAVSGGPVVVACDGTFFKRWGHKVFQARWAYDGSAQGGKKVAFGNTWVVAAIVVRLPFCSSPVALPVLFRLWRGKGTASQVDLAAEMLGKLRAILSGLARLLRRIRRKALFVTPRTFCDGTPTWSNDAGATPGASRDDHRCGPRSVDIPDPDCSWPPKTRPGATGVAGQIVGLGRRSPRPQCGRSRKRPESIRHPGAVTRPGPSSSKPRHPGFSPATSCTWTRSCSPGCIASPWSPRHSPCSHPRRGIHWNFQQISSSTCGR